ncbi:sulfite reductase flavoprotein subunit alpha [Acinetobacter sp. NIPH 2377]|uniref:sulfite reductase subunit alpha n=1 Tax=Acinetobacter terrestris TaxID=2529843 RepID=UPI00148F7B8D|nr:sulfite reductase flavoprotein subunit alpha [Acinetobacter terrestris]NNH36719.1 sulfite reductase flavoprotein subunit alpha [Acinetobacter terrestris]
MTHPVAVVLIALAILLLLYAVIIAYLILINAKQKQEVKLNQNDYLIIFASQSGQAENFAWQTAQQLQDVGQSVTVVDIQYLTVEQLRQANKVLWFVSTYGEGDAPDTARMALKHIFSDPALDLSHQSYAILALGDKRYFNFCQFGQLLNQYLQQHQAQALFEMVCVDHLKQADVNLWTQRLEQLTQQQLMPVEPAQNWHCFILKNRLCLNNGSQGNPIYQIQLSYAEGLTWSSGDILQVQSGNRLEDIQTFLQAQQQTANDDLLAALQFKNLRQFPEQLPNESFEDWIQRFDELAIREYSIASIPEQGCVELVVRQEKTATGLGLGSGWLTEHALLGQAIVANIRSNSAFHLKPIHKPLILIGNGTGIAGLVAHLSQRQQWGDQQNWLIFGERQQQFDHLYKDQIQEWQAQGLLPDVDYAFSRDQVEKVYVQHIFQRKSEQLLSWIEAGAAIYVCGSLKGMAQEVEQTLLNILGAEQLEQLRIEGRYQRDVY